MLLQLEKALGRKAARHRRVCHLSFRLNLIVSQEDFTLSPPKLFRTEPERTSHQDTVDDDADDFIYPEPPYPTGVPGLWQGPGV
jgi:hypothetical protein